MAITQFYKTFPILVVTVRCRLYQFYRETTNHSLEIRNQLTTELITTCPKPTTPKIAALIYENYEN